jgi:hypothetical protein
VQHDARFRGSLQAALRSATVALDVELLAPDASAPTPAPYRVTVEERGAGYDIRVLDDERDRIYTRRVEGSGGDDEVAHEAAVHVVVYALEALGRGETIGTPRAPPPPSVTVGPTRPASAPSPIAAVDRAVPLRPTTFPQSPRFSFGTRASVTSYASNAPAIFGVGAFAALRFPQWAAFEIAVSIQQHALTEIRSASLSSRFQMHSARMFLGYDLVRTPATAIGPALGLGLDRIGVTTGPRAGRSEPSISSHDVIGVAVLALGARAALASHLRVQGDLGIELPLQHVEYVVQRTSGTVTFLEPWPVRPWISVALVAEL